MGNGGCHRLPRESNLRRCRSEYSEYKRCIVQGFTSSFSIHPPIVIAVFCRSSSTALQLQSIAARYRQPLSLQDDGFHRIGNNARRLGKPPQTLTPVVLPRGDDDRLQRLEAVLFLAREPLGSRKIGRYANLADATEVRTLIRELNRRYDDAGRAFRVEEVAGGYRLLSRAKFGSWIRRLQHVPPETRLSAPALETLAVVAYRQPVLRADVEAVRGVSCGEILRQLLERELVRIDGRSDELGRPYLYATTSRFLQVFGLQCLENLPRKEQFATAGAGLSDVETDETDERETEEFDDR